MATKAGTTALAWVSMSIYIGVETPSEAGYRFLITLEPYFPKIEA